ncbi:hypothetical protein AMK59_2415, partial [Oryctes borbonicus]
RNVQAPMDFVWILTVLLLEVALPYDVYALLNFERSSIAAITRLNNGDTFQAKGVECDYDTCVGLSSGTAAISQYHRSEQGREACVCQCHSHLPAFREDLQICVDDIRGRFT